MDELFPFVVLAAAIVGVPALLAWALARQRRSSEGAAAPSDGPAALRRLLGPELEPSLQELFGGHDLALVVEPGLARLRWTMPTFGREDPARLGRALRLAAALAKRLEAPSAGA